MSNEEQLEQDVECFAQSIAEFGIVEFMVTFKKQYPQDYDSFLVKINDVIEVELREV